MLTDPNLIPQNSLNPVPQNDADWQRYLQVQGAAIAAQVGFQQATAQPSTFADQGSGLQSQIMTTQGYDNRQLLVLTDALKPDVNSIGQAGAIISDQDLSDAPNVVPMNVVPSMQPSDTNSIAAQQARLNIRRQPGVPWGIAPAGTPNTCSGSTAGTVIDQIKTNPWAWLFLLAGVGVVLYSAAKD